MQLLSSPLLDLSFVHSCFLCCYYLSVFSKELSDSTTESFALYYYSIIIPPPNKSLQDADRCTAGVLGGTLHSART